MIDGEAVGLCEVRIINNLSDVECMVIGGASLDKRNL
jgi:hypothetical protein